MANRKDPKDISGQGRQSGKQMAEKSPGPHGESKILQMPIRTQQRNETTGRNIPKVPNTIGGNLNPSVAHDFERNVVSPKDAPDKRSRAPRPIKEIKQKDA